MNIPPERYNFTLDYSPADFFYSTNAAYMPSPDTCLMLRASPPANCDTSAATEKACYEYQMCLNKDLVETLYAKRDKHSGAEAKLLDFQSKYKFEVLKSFNLGVGIILLGVYIYYQR